MQKTALGLLRVSTSGQVADGREGIAAQRRAVESVASIHKVEIVDWVELPGVSGAAVLGDPRFRDLLMRLRAREVDGVIVAEFSRLTRPAKLSDYAILEAFREAGATLWTPEGPRDLRDFSGRLLSVLQGEMAADERERIRERTMRAKEVHRRAGRHVQGKHTLPLGLDYDKDTGSWSFVEPGASIVREVFRRFLAGERNLTGLAREVGLTRSRVKGILRNPSYTGTRRISTRKENGRDVPRAPEDVIEFDMGIEPLVSRSDWDRVQEVLAGRRGYTVTRERRPHSIRSRFIFL